MDWIDWKHAVGSFVGVMPALAAALLLWSIGYYRNMHREDAIKAAVERLHVEVNGRLGELIEAIKKQAHSEGRAEGIEWERIREERAPQNPHLGGTK
jgi:hypothetical protein